jgi:hypothetical protein
MSARAITAALGGRWHGRYGMARCVVHDDRTPSLQIADGESALLLKCWAGCDPRDVLGELRRRGLLDERPADRTPWQRHAPRPTPSPAPAPVRAAAARAAIEIWHRAGFAQPGTPVARYVERRGMAASAMPHEAIRYAPHLKHYSAETRTTTYWPAMIALFLSARDLPVAIHRTWLTADGEKAPVDPPRKMLGPAAGAAIRLTDAGAVLPRGSTRRLIVGEGIETMMALIHADVGAERGDLWDQPSPGTDIWACGSTSGLRALVLPAAWRWRVVIAADHDANGAGLKAAEETATRLRAEGHTANVVLPATTGDWNDTLTEARP